LVTLRDLARGRIPFGYGTTRGLGSIRVESVTFGLSKDIAARLGIAADGPVVLKPDDFEQGTAMESFASIQKVWQDYWTHGAVPK
jgi:hypothetical protein